VVSPLLANIYMHRYIKAFRRYGLGERYGAVLVTYADDLVVLCRRGAEEVLAYTRQWMERIGLKLNEEKSSIRHAHREAFDFLGYTFGPFFFRRTGTRYLGAKPSAKSVKRLKHRIRLLLRPHNTADWESICLSLNRTLQGWANYFCYGSHSKVRHQLDRYVYDRVRHFLRRRSKRAGRGVRVFPMEKVFGELGVLSVQKMPVRSRRMP
jgi:RNA-directed DNA polymerase